MSDIITSSTVKEILTGLEEMHPEAMCALEHKDTFQLLIAVVLSAQTTDVSVNKVTPALFERFPDPRTLAAADQAQVEGIIRTIGLYKNKAVNIIRLSSKLIDDFDGKVPGNYEDLISLPGVGRKTANVVLAEGFGVQRIAVDTHVFRVANRIGLTDEKDVTATEESLMRVLPDDQWIRAHHLLIFHGRKVCAARKPKCEICLIRQYCHYYSENNSRDTDDKLN